MFLETYVTSIICLQQVGPLAGSAGCFFAGGAKEPPPKELSASALGQFWAPRWYFGCPEVCFNGFGGHVEKDLVAI